MAVGDIYSLTYIWTLHGQICNYVLHLKAKSAAATATTLVDTQLNFWIDTVRLLMSSECVFVSKRALRTVGASPDEAEKTFTGTVLGSVASPCPSSFIASVWSTRTGGFGRRKRGRVFIGGIPLSHILNSQLTTSGLGSHQNNSNSLVNRYGAAGTDSNWQWGVWSRLNGGSGTVINAVGFTPITLVNVKAVLGSQRKRKIGVGN